MTGAEHYLAAERLLAGTPKSEEDRLSGIGHLDVPWPPSEMHLREAQVHATLALAAFVELVPGAMVHATLPLAAFVELVPGAIP